MTLVAAVSDAESFSESYSSPVIPSIRKNLRGREKGWEERTKFEHLKEDFEWWKDNFLVNYNFIKKHFSQLLTIQSSMETFVDSVWQMKKIAGKMRKYSEFFEPADWVYFLDCVADVKEFRGYFHFES